MTTKAFFYKSLTSFKGSISLVPKIYVPRGQRSCNRACTERDVCLDLKSKTALFHFSSFCRRKFRRLACIVCISTTVALFGLVWFRFSLTDVPKVAETPDWESIRESTFHPNRIKQARSKGCRHKCPMVMISNCRNG